MGNTWFTADTHYRHKKVITFGDHRPFSTIEEHDDTLRARHNAVVRPKDIVWFLGDVWLGKDPEEMIKWFKTLNGDKRLISGNHDTFSTAAYLEVFTQVHGVWPKYGFVMSHVPLHPDSVERWGLNVHGHLHDKKVKTITCVPYSDWQPFDSRYYCVSVEQHKLAPVSLDTVRKATCG